LSMPIHSLPAPVAPRPLSHVVTHAANALRGVAQKIDAWIGTRERAAADRDALACMSDRERLDIGLDRAGVYPVECGARVRDYFY